MNAAYNNAMAALAVAQGEPVNCDDMGMATASDADLRAWADDLADRVGLNVDAFRVALEAFITERKSGGMDAVTGAVAEFALAAYYSEANVPESERHDDDAHALLNGCYDVGSWLDAAEAAGHSMGNTRAACATWHALMTDCLGFSGPDAARVFAEAGDMVNGNAGLRGTLADEAERERGTWQGIADASGHEYDTEAAHAWAQTLEALSMTA